MRENDKKLGRATFIFVFRESCHSPSRKKEESKGAERAEAKLEPFEERGPEPSLGEPEFHSRLRK